VEKRLGEPGHSPYTHTTTQRLFGEDTAKADVRLYTILVGFDVAYINISTRNLKMIPYDCPRLSGVAGEFVLGWRQNPERACQERHDLPYSGRTFHSLACRNDHSR
jgi:hypothetical protein